MSEKFQQLAVILVLILSVVPSANSSSFEVDNYDILKYEGFVAYEMAALDKNDKSPTNTVDKCSCGGTGRVKSGDGLLTMDCPCQPNCLCGKDKPVKPAKLCENPNCQCVNCVCKTKECESSWAKRILIFGYKDCPPCNQFKKTELVKLTKRPTQPWNYGNKPSNLIQEIDIETEDGEKLVEKYETDSYPAFIIVDKTGKELDRQVGFFTAKELTDLYYSAK